MKIGLILEELIKEGASPLLYHFTYTHRLLNILTTNALFLTPRTGGEKTGGKDYFISFSRTKTTTHGYGMKFNQPNSVRLNMDGQKLGHNYKVKPIDYWQYAKTPEIMKQGSGDEMEDRLVSNNNEISNASKYIISIDIFQDKDGVDENIISLGKQLGIKINIYDNLNDFKVGHPRKAIDPNIRPSDGKNNTTKDRSTFIVKTIGSLIYKNPELKDKVFNELVNKFNVTTEYIEEIGGLIDKYHKHLDYYLRPNDSHNLSDLSSSLDGELHNNKTSSDSITRYIMKEFLSDMKKTKSSSVKEYLDGKLYIGKKRQRDFNKVFNNKMDKVIKDSYMEVLMANADYSVYDREGNQIEHMYKYEPVSKFLNSKISEIRNYTSNYILNNDDMYKYSYVLSPNEIKGKIDLSDGNLDAKKAVSGLENVDGSELMYILQRVLWSIDEFYFDEVNKMQEEYKEQFNK